MHCIVVVVFSTICTFMALEGPSRRLEGLAHDFHAKTCIFFTFTMGAPVRLGLEDRANTLEPEPAKMTVVVECPPEMGFRTRHSFCINSHQSNVASTIANKDINNTFNQKYTNAQLDKVAPTLGNCAYTCNCCHG